MSLSVVTASVWFRTISLFFQYDVCTNARQLNAMMIDVAMTAKSGL
jgi:hypothetical protein